MNRKLDLKHSKPGLDLGIPVWDAGVPNGDLTAVIFRFKKYSQLCVKK